MFGAFLSHLPNGSLLHPKMSQMANGSVSPGESEPNGKWQGFFLPFANGPEFPCHWIL